MRISIIFFLLYAVLIFSGGCAGSKKMSVEKQMLHYSVILSSGGGFTGRYEGKVIDTTGIISTWSGRIFSTSDKKVVDSLSQNQIKILNTFFDENRLEDFTYREVGNMTTSLSLLSANKEINFSWKEQPPPERVPAKVKELYYLIINEIANTHNKERK